MKPYMWSIRLRFFPVDYYRISGNIDNIFNLAVWPSVSQSPNLCHHNCIDLLTMLCLAVQLPNLISTNIKLQPDLMLIAKLIFTHFWGFSMYPCLWGHILYDPNGTHRVKAFFNCFVRQQLLFHF